MKFSLRGSSFAVPLPTSVYYLTIYIAKYSRKSLVVLLKPANTAKVLLSESFHVYSILYSIKSKQTRCIKKFEFEKGSRDRNKK